MYFGDNYSKVCFTTRILVIIIVKYERLKGK